MTKNINKILIIAASFCIAQSMKAPDATAVNAQTTKKTFTENSSKKTAEKKTKFADILGNNSHTKLTSKTKDLVGKSREIYLNFDNADLSNFIEYMAERKGINLIPNAATAGVKISLTIREPLTIDEAWDVFQTILEMGGFAIVKVGDVHKIVAKDTKYTEPLPVYIGIPAESLPNSDKTVRFVTFLNNIPVSEIEPVLKTMLNPGAQLILQNSLNGMVITDCCYNIKSAMKVAHELDTSGYQETVTVMNLQQANAAEVKRLLDNIIKKPEQSSLARLLGYNSEDTTDYFAPSTKVIAEERTNALILLGNKKSIDKVVDFVSKYIDKTMKVPKNPINIYELKYADAEQIKSILDDVTNTQSQSAAAKFGGIRGGVKYFSGVRVEADKDGNRLIVSCVDQQDWKFIRETIRDLDKAQPQVAIETLIVQIDQTDTKELGGQLRNIEHGLPIKGLDFQGAGIGPIQVNESGSNITSILGNLLNTVSSGLSQGSTVLSLSKGGSVWAIFKALKQQTNASILDRPFVTVANRVEATVSVGESRRIEKEVAGEQSGFETVQIAKTIKFKPQINPNGIINLDVKIDLSDFVDSEGKQRDTKEVKTNVTVANGQVLVLGGFVKTKVTESGGKTPVLGNIPILGWLCKNKSRSLTKNYIFIFVCPTIIKPRTTPGASLYTKMKLHDATEYIEETVETKVVKDPIHNWFFNPDKENYSHKVVDFANARYQPTTVDIRTDPYYRSEGQIDLSDLEGERSTSLPIKFETRTSRKKGEASKVSTMKTDMLASDDDDLEEQRRALRTLVANGGKGSHKPLGKEEVKTSKGKFKTFVSEHKSEERMREHTSKLAEDKGSFKTFIQPPRKISTKIKRDSGLESKKMKFKQLLDPSLHKEPTRRASYKPETAKSKLKKMLAKNDDSVESEERVPPTQIKDTFKKEILGQKQSFAKRFVPKESHDSIIDPSIEYEREIQRRRLKSLLAEKPMKNPFENRHNAAEEEG
ncbi:secretin N-terminal domain-containing protein [Candidatus Dependentiae bacterium]